MSSQPAAGDKRSALNAPDTDDDDGCAEQGGGAEAAGPNPEQAGTRNKKLRRNGEARNLSQSVATRGAQDSLPIIRQIREMEVRRADGQGWCLVKGLHSHIAAACLGRQDLSV